MYFVEFVGLTKVGGSRYFWSTQEKYILLHVYIVQLLQFVTKLLGEFKLIVSITYSRAQSNYCNMFTYIFLQQTTFIGSIQHSKIISCTVDSTRNIVLIVYVLSPESRFPNLVDSIVLTNPGIALTQDE